MMILKPYEICSYENICPHKGGCYGIKKDRDGEFTCQYISFENGKPCFTRDNNFKKTEYNINDTNKKILHG